MLADTTHGNSLETLMTVLQPSRPGRPRRYNILGKPFPPIGGDRSYLDPFQTNPFYYYRVVLNYYRVILMTRYQLQSWVLVLYATSQSNVLFWYIIEPISPNIDSAPWYQSRLIKLTMYGAQYHCPLPAPSRPRRHARVKTMSSVNCSRLGVLLQCLA